MIFLMYSYLERPFGLIRGSKDHDSMHMFNSDLSVRRKHMSRDTVVLVLAIAKVSAWWLGGWKEGRGDYRGLFDWRERVSNT